ncbi:Uncharacterized protein Fot_11844 [Forsythia ovata]|uniref:Uncharacterized protein n=1 Tax=Forsythia ovata TaxID=205694 RepID=A0ABD1WKU7_9LAMI
MSVSLINHDYDPLRPDKLKTTIIWIPTLELYITSFQDADRILAWLKDALVFERVKSSSSKRADDDDAKKGHHRWKIQTTLHPTSTTHTATFFSTESEKLFSRNLHHVPNQNQDGEFISNPDKRLPGKVLVSYSYYIIYDIREKLNDQSRS